MKEDDTVNTALSTVLIRGEEALGETKAERA
jgi:hypothetical protein